jgi:hypothetical protein
MGSVCKVSEGVRVDKLRRDSSFVTQRRSARKWLKEESNRRKILTERIPYGGGIDGQVLQGETRKELSTIRSWQSCAGVSP